MSGEEHLSNAIILQAVRDYRAILRWLKKHPEDRNAQLERKELEGFFLSDWFRVLSNADSRALLNRLQKEVA